MEEELNSKTTILFEQSSDYQSNAKTNVKFHQLGNNQSEQNISNSEAKKSLFSSPLFFRERKRLQSILKKKHNEREEQFDKLRSQYDFGQEELAITSLSWNDLVGKLQRRELTATAVLNAFIGKALQVQDKCNPITDFIPDARKWAKELDESSEIKGPLHGVPCAIKDDIDVEGLDTTHGFIKRLYKPSPESAVLVKVLKDLGAVPFCKTNIPQTLFTFGSDNPVFGTTTNCHNSKLSPGGSSSGSGALVGGGGSPFATGTDIGGSLRIPAHFNGASSLKPTNGRISMIGFQCSLPNAVGVTVSLGIIGRTPSIVADVIKSIIESEQQLKYDSVLLPIPWDQRTFASTGKLRIGYCTSLPFFPSMGDSSDKVLETKAALESLGHTLVPYEMPDGYKFFKLLGKFLLADNGRYFTKCWESEDVAQSMKLIWLATKIPIWLQKVIGRLMMSKAIPFIHSKRTGNSFGSGAVASTDIWDATGERNALREQVLQEWHNSSIDLVICNVMPFPAPLVDAPGMLTTATAYCALWNIVDFPAGVVTMGQESGKKLSSYDDEGDMTLKFAKKSVQDSVKAPIGVQVVGKPYKDELVLRVMKELEPFNKFKPSSD